MEVVTLIADIVNSKEIQNRANFQKELKNKLDAISKGKAVLSPYTITLGDEFQAIYKNTNDVLNDVLDIILYLYPIRLRVSIGIGDLNTEVNTESSIGMDGPVFHIARNGIEELKKLETTIIQIYDFNTDIDLELINKGLSLAMSEINNWKLNTFKIFTGLLHNKKINDIYPEIHISQRGVYKLIQTNNVEAYVDFFRVLNKKLNIRYSI